MLTVVIPRRGAMSALGQKRKSPQSNAAPMREERGSQSLAAEI